MSSSALKKYLEKSIGEKFKDDLFAEDPIFLLDSESGIFLRSLGPYETLVLRNGPGGGESIGIISMYSLSPGYFEPPRPLKVLEGTQWETDLIIDCRNALEKLGFIKILIPGVDYTPEESHARA